MDIMATELGFHKRFEELKVGVSFFCCDHSDSEVVHKTAQILLPGLATACIDNTTGDPFKGPASVAIEIRKEMVDYLMHRSETYVAATMIQEVVPDVESSDHPIDIVSDFIDDFASSKRNMFSQISGWLLSEKREDKIDDFVQEMEMNAFWSMDRREAIAKNILKNLDFKNTFCCEMKFDTAEELAEHSHQCIFRSIDCSNEGCRARFSAVHMEKHDSFCPFKVLPCEQKCSENILRCEMDRHCITVCPMKLANCPFHHLGCQSIIPHCAIEEHCTVSLHSHLLYVLRVIHKQASAEDLNHWVEVLEKSLSPSQAQDARSLTFAVRDLEAHMGPLEHNPRSVSDN
ncbi:uncharacterized protein LOC122083382 isoform X1 [Macadamia integrifolia]|uniref:uncharacterized protein LOC122083382 isoform X1 n=1 Tax=Macadamia integrifolia TaxID=60698 RepID=UPI001C4FA178|nr:uncharacterized protein LOC122083382 isoform X1 [Macadamia integrifolia]XP_042507092.1 uncharacterized protein LOC122083382 isoform X1 [Macadamia integrifolia]XP_042507094.1 uncharacterized protein LOC122083382 isoform X1 [Macadamia integrifolia]